MGWLWLLKQLSLNFISFTYFKYKIRIEYTFFNQIDVTLHFQMSTDFADSWTKFWLPATFEIFYLSDNSSFSTLFFAKVLTNLITIWYDYMLHIKLIMQESWLLSFTIMHENEFKRILKNTLLNYKRMTRC